MALMSSLLLCTFVVMVPQALAESLIKTDWYTIYNNTLKNRQRPSSHNKILLNINAPPLVNVVSEVQAVFAEAVCQNCLACMERAIKADKINSHMVDTRPNHAELQTGVLLDQYKFDSNRQKRDIAANDTNIKIKSKKNKVNKSVTIRKYNEDDELYALKIKETITQKTDSQGHMKSSSTTCQIYNVKKSFPCETPEGDTFLTAAKRKANKKSKKEKEKHNVKATTIKRNPYHYKKRQVDNSQVPENFMPSIEDLY